MTCGPGLCRHDVAHMALEADGQGGQEEEDEEVSLYHTVRGITPLVPLLLLILSDRIFYLILSSLGRVAKCATEQVMSHYLCELHADACSVTGALSQYPSVIVPGSVVQEEVVTRRRTRVNGP